MKVSAKSFVAFLNASGRSKVGEVARCREPYRPERDFYKRLREAFERCSDASSLSGLIHGDALTTNPSKLRNFSLILEAFDAYTQEHHVQILPFSKRTWVTGPSEIATSSVVRLSIDGCAHLVMLWFTATEPSRPEIEYFSGLVELAYRVRYPNDCFGVFDVRNQRLHTAPIDPWLEQFLSAELLAFQSIWDAFDDAA